MSDDVRRLSEPNPFGDVLQVDAPREDLVAAATRWSTAGFAVGTVDGAVARKRDPLFAEFSRALQFPAYAEPEWTSFGDCLADLDWLSLDVGVVVVVLDAHLILDRVLARRREASLALLMRHFHDAANTFATPITVGEWWDRPAIPFHVVLQATGRSVRTLEQRWTRAGAMLRPFDLETGRPDPSLGSTQ